MSAKNKECQHRWGPSFTSVEMVWVVDGDGFDRSNRIIRKRNCINCGSQEQVHE